jgi:hypothetical protein
MLARPTMLCGGIIFSALPWGEYRIYDVPGVYMFVRRDRDGDCEILYIGQTANIARDLGPSHPAWEDAFRQGMDEIHVHLLTDTLEDRLSVEAYLVRQYDPPLNRRKLKAPARRTVASSSRGA